MKPLPTPVYWSISITLIMISFVLLMPSIIGVLLSLILVIAWADFSSRRRRLAASTFNSAVRAVCHQEGAVGKVAVAFSRAGPLSGPCYDYARRLMMGENPIDAAVPAGIPLRFSTAIALEVPTRRTESGERSPYQELDSPSREDGSMPAYGQVVYLVATAFLSCMAIAWLSVKVAPVIKTIHEEFEIGGDFVHLLDTTPAFVNLAVLGLIVLVVVPILNRGQLFGIRFEHWIPNLPALAQRKSETLWGLADAIDAGMPMGRALAIGHAITLGRAERHRLEMAMHGIAQGLTPPDALLRAGLIGPRDEPWLRDKTPERTAELLRVIADQAVRDAESNLRGLMSVLFPVCIVALGLAVGAYASGMLGGLMELINGLSKIQPS